MLKNVNEFGEYKSGDTVTFAHELISIGGQILHEKGSTGIIRSFTIVPGHWYRTLPDIWVEDKLSTIQLEGEQGVSFIPDTFLEFQTIKSKP